MRYSLIMLFIISSFISGIIIVRGTFNNNINNKPGQVLGAIEFINDSSSDVEVLSIQLLGEQAKEPSSNKNLVPIKINDENIIRIEAAAGVAFDPTSGRLLFAQDASKSLPIASITKLATALVFLENNPGWETVYEVSQEDIITGGRIYLSIGEKIFIRDLFLLSLVGSANTATMALIHSTGMSEAEFVRAMNNKALELGLTNTRFSDPVGLLPDNISTAYEVAQLAQVALAKKDIQEAVLSKTYEFTTISGNDKVVKNTDILLSAFSQNGITLLGGKTGYHQAAGYCFVGKFRNSEDREIITVILGDTDSYARFNNTETLVKWVYENYEWK